MYCRITVNKLKMTLTPLKPTLDLMMYYNYILESPNHQSKVVLLEIMLNHHYLHYNNQFHRVATFIKSSNVKPIRILEGSPHIPNLYSPEVKHKFILCLFLFSNMSNSMPLNK